MRQLEWTNGRVTILCIYSFALGGGMVLLIDDLHARTIGAGDIVGILVVIAVLVTIVVGAARRPPYEAGTADGHRSNGDKL